MLKNIALVAVLALINHYGYQTPYPVLYDKILALNSEKGAIYLGFSIGGTGLALLVS